jgi:hypothetical protein
MRRIASIILFIIGGFCVGMQVMIAFIAGGGPDDYAGRWAYFTAIAALFLALATWASPGQRWRELGLSMLIGAAVCVGSFAITITATPEEGGTGGIGPLEGYVDWTRGWVNVGAIVIAGAALYFIGGSARRA